MHVFNIFYILLQTKCGICRYPTILHQKTIDYQRNHSYSIISPMKLFYTLTVVFLCSVLNVQSQDFPLQFADSEGNIIADGTVLVLNTPEVIEDEFDDGVIIPSGVYVKNTTADEVYCGTEYSISQISNGALQTCFPLNCIQRRTTGSWTSEVSALSGNMLKSMQTEWIPDAEGYLTADFQLLKYKLNPITKKYTEDSRGPKIQMRFEWNPSSIQLLENDLRNISRVEYFTLDGRKVQVPTHGVYVVRVTYSTGAVKTTRQLF